MILKTWCCTALLAFSMGAHAIDSKPDVVATQGGSELTVGEFEALMAEIPESERNGFASDPERLTLLVKNALVAKQLATRALAGGKIDQARIDNAMELHRSRLLAGQYMDDLRASIEYPSFDRMAQEKYLATPERYTRPAEVDIRYVLVKTEGRTEAEAMAKAKEAHAAAKSGEDFQKVIARFTEEPRGTMDDAQWGSASDLVLSNPDTPLDKAVEGLKVGDLTEPFVDKGYVYVVKITGRRDALKASFDEVKPAIIEELRAKYESDQVNAAIAGARDGEIHFNETLLPQLRDKYVDKE